ncbi:peptidylprolyl isomerase [Sediminibacterium soli]|uniref:peptidylprolyl isomerase n=1 Tax=Sediminibacterium soli TaxID=2698829 RepID=UPI00137AC486|nr:peptidylprolyl isomerase [Sediminibacterium soli]NCI47863.1 peptidylprolyl isomerase [Sediminibacterium soli]
MRRAFAFILLSFGLVCCKQTNTATPHIEIQTSKGDIELELYADRAPNTVAAFLSYIDSGFYNNASFYRVLNDENQPSNAPKTELIQGGIWKTNQQRSASLPGIPHENTQLTKLHHGDGTISLARLAPGTATTEFFICIDEQPGLDSGGENIADGQGYAAFGKVVKGMDIVRKIYRQNETDQYFDPPVAIFGIRRK